MRSFDNYTELGNLLSAPEYFPCRKFRKDHPCEPESSILGASVRSNGRKRGQTPEAIFVTLKLAPMVTSSEIKFWNLCSNSRN